MELGTPKPRTIGGLSYASMKLRIYAACLDSMVIVAYGVILGAASFLLRPYLIPLFTSTPFSAQLTGFLLITLPVTLYFALCECSKWQGTWGKRKFGIRVVNRAGNRMGPGTSLFRSAVKFLPWEMAHFSIWRLRLPSDYPETFLLMTLIFVNLIVIIYFICPFTNKYRRSVYDLAARTLVR